MHQKRSFHKIVSFMIICVKMLLLETMFFMILSIFLKDRSSGGAARSYDFHAGAWLRQAPASGGAVFHSRTLSQSQASTSGRQRPCRATQGVGPNLSGSFKKRKTDSDTSGE